MEYIIIGKVGITNEGKWNPLKPFPNLALVEHEGQSYISFVESVGVEPGTDDSVWMLMAKRGESLYQMMVREHLFEGTEAEFLAQYQQLLEACRKATSDSRAQMNTVTETMNAYAADETSREDAEALRKEAENLRVQAEAARVEAERLRTEAESLRETGERRREQDYLDYKSQLEVAVRQAASATTLANEAAQLAQSESAKAKQLSEEASRLIADVQRTLQEAQATLQNISAAEDNRVKQELARASAESARSGAETARKEAESGRVNAEENRQLFESSRKETEANRQEAEVGRTQTEAARVAAEQSRSDSEKGRNTSESERRNAELTRASQEDARKLNETARAEAETARKSAEDVRAAAETARESKESARQSAETTREGGETKRQSAEAVRQAQEQERERVFGEKNRQLTEKMSASDTATGNAVAAATRANDEAARAALAADTIDAKISPVVANDKLQDEKLQALDTAVAELQQFHGDDYCVASYEKQQMAPEALEVKGSRAFALAWYPWLVDMTDNAGPAVTHARTLKNNNWFRYASDGAFAPAVCVPQESYDLCNAELYLDAAHTQKYCDAGAFDAEAFYNEYGVTQKLYTVDGAEVQHIRRPWETTNKDLGQFVGRKDTIRLCDNLIGRSGKVLKGVFGSQTNFDGAQFGQFELKPTGLSPTPVCTVGNKTRSFFYLMEGDPSCRSYPGLGNVTSMLAPKDRTFPRAGDMQQVNDMKWARANNADPTSPVPFAEGGFHAYNTFITCMEVAYGTKFIHDPEMFSSGVSSNDGCSSEETWRHHGGIRLRRQGETEYKYAQWNQSTEMYYNEKGQNSNLSYQLNQYGPKVGVNEMQIAASYAVELGIPEGQEFEMYGYTYWWKAVPGTRSLADGEMNCRMYKVVKGLYNGFLKDGTPQVWELECCFRVGLLQGMDISGDVFAYWGGGYEQIGHTIKAGNGTGFPVNFYLQPDQRKWKNITAVTIDDTEKFGVEDEYIHTGQTVNKGDSYTLERNAYSGYPEERGGSIRTGECFFSWNNNYWCSTIHKFCRIAARFRGHAYYYYCSPRILHAYNAVSNTYYTHSGSAQVLLGGPECNALQAQPQTQSAQQ